MGHTIEKGILDLDAQGSHQSERVSVKSCDSLEVWTVRPISRGMWTANTNQVLGKIDVGGTVSFSDTESISMDTRSDCELPTLKVPTGISGNVRGGGQGLRFLHCYSHALL